MAKKFFLEKRLECMMTNPKDIRRKRWSTKSVLCSQVFFVLCLFSLNLSKTGLELEF